MSRLKNKKIISEENIIRYFPSVNEGLNDSQIEERNRNNLINFDVNIKSKSYFKIITSNLFTLFNGINVFLAILLFINSSYKNALFMGIVVINVLIAIAQEIRAKKTIDKLSLLNETKAKVIRNGILEHIGIYNLVLDDIILLENGDQVPSDCIIISGSCECNESLITGESESIKKEKSSKLFSGSFIVSGKCYAKIEKINEGNFIFSILKGAKYIKQTKSDIITSLNKIIRVVSFIIFPIGFGIYFSSIFRGNIPQKQAIDGTVAALIGMIPEGLILLASSVFAVSVVKLSKKKIMVQDLYCAETLARVDTLCLDKTGTITEGIMEVSDIIPLNKVAINEIENILSNISNCQPDSNATINAIKDKFKIQSKNFNLKKVIPFSSQRKYSGIEFEEGSFVIGATEFILKNIPKELKKQLNKLAEENRVILLAKLVDGFEDEKIVSEPHPIAFILIRDKIRKEAPDTLRYFKEQGVDIKIISGDNVVTVSNIAKRAGVQNHDNCIDMSLLNTEQEVKEAALKYTVFGRVKPDQKKLLVQALKEAGRTVGMTGDGVNDVLALKEADCSIAMASGSEAAKNVSQLVLLDSNFASMPEVVAEGRQAINNLQLSGSLFLVKTFYSMIISIFTLIVGSNYPLVSIQLTLVSTFSVGIPSFWLALSPNKKRLKGRFIINIMKRALPASIGIVIGYFIIYWGMENFAKQAVVGTTQSESSLYYLKFLFPLNNETGVLFDKTALIKYRGTMTILTVATIQFMILFSVAKPYTFLKSGLCALMLTIFFIISVTFKNIHLFGRETNIFEIYTLNNKYLYFVLLLSIFSATSVYLLLNAIINKSMFVYRKAN